VTSDYVTKEAMKQLELRVARKILDRGDLDRNSSGELSLVPRRSPGQPSTAIKPANAALRENDRSSQLTRY